MEAIKVTNGATGQSLTSVLAVGFGTTVAMWAVGYVGRLPALMLPSPLVLVLLVACLFAGGVVLGRYANVGWLQGATAGLVAGVLNLLVLGSLLSGDRPNEIAPSALLWLPGSVLLAAVLAGAGAAAGTLWAREDRPAVDWCAAFVRVNIAAGLLLLAVGGLVTSTGAGLAVVDWPNSFGYNMFLYPLSRMTGGVYYEHAHRLFGALVGLTTLMLAIVLQFQDRRRWVRRLGWLAVVMVIVQGVLGGLRVTGGFTLSTSPEVMRPSLALALVHGVLGQLFFATLVALGAFTSPTWRREIGRVVRPSARADRLQAGMLVGLMMVQLVFGATQRHFSHLLFVHIVVAVALVAPLALHVGFRSWGLSPGVPLLQRLGLGLAAAVVLQIVLGFVAFAARGGAERAAVPQAFGLFDVTIRTTHQWFGAVLLALAVLLLCWNLRLLSDD